MSIKRLKKQHLGFEFAEASDLPIGSQGEVITADTLKPYLDQIAQKATPAQITDAVNALETKILGGAGIDEDTLAELNAKIVALQNLTDGDKTGILNLLALKVNTTDIMPIVNAKADESTVASRLAAKADETSVASRLAAKADEASVASRLADKADETSVASRLAAKADETSVASRLATKASESSVASRLADKASETSVASRLAAKADETSVANRLAEKVDTEFLTSNYYNESEMVAYVNNNTTTKLEEFEETVVDFKISQFENKILGGVGTDADTLAELKSMVENLQSLSSADVNGVITALASKLDKAVFDNWFESVEISGRNGTYTEYRVKRDLIVQNLQAGVVTPQSIVISNITPDYAMTSSNVAPALVQNDGRIQVIIADAEGKYHCIDLVQFISLLANDSNSQISQKISQKVNQSQVLTDAEITQIYETNFDGVNGDYPSAVEALYSDPSFADDSKLISLKTVRSFMNFLQEQFLSQMQGLTTRVTDLEGMFENV